MRADPKTEADVMAVLNRCSEAYARREIGPLMACFASDPDVVLIGTGADEKRIGVDQVRALPERDWSQSEASSFRLEAHVVSAAGSVAWVTSEMTFDFEADGQEMTLAGRMTAVLEKRGDQWLIAQAHFSLPTPGQEEGQSFPT